MGVVVFVAFKCANPPQGTGDEARVTWLEGRTDSTVCQTMNAAKNKKKDPVTKKNPTFNKDLLDMLHVWL